MGIIESRSFGRTDIGKVREENQDQFIIAELARSMRIYSNSMGLDTDARLHGGELGYLFLVADGMGGHRGGREASQLAIRYFLTSILNSMRWIVRIEPGAEGRFLDDLQWMLTNAHKEMQKYSERETDLKGMGSTLTMSYVAWPRMIIVHAGDTRCYVLRGKNFKLITRDHTVANELMRSGKITADAEGKSPWANVLVNALGAGAPDVYADIYKFDLEEGDRLLLCSDGLNKHLKDDEIQSILCEVSDSKVATDRLVDTALERGGSDNITVIVADFHKNTQPSRMPLLYSARCVDNTLFDAPTPVEEIDTVDSAGKGTEPFIDEYPTTDFT